MAAIGTGWVDGAWIEAGWVSGAWASAVDVTAPILSTPSTTNPTVASIDLTATTDTTEGEATAVITTSPTKPRISQVLAGTDHNDVAATWDNVGSEEAVSTTAITIAAAGLPQDVPLYGYIVHEDVALNPSLVGETGEFTLLAPVLSDLQLSVATITTGDISVVTTVGAGELFLLFKGTPGATDAEVKASPVSTTVNSPGLQEFLGVAGFIPGQTYYLYALQVTESVDSNQEGVGPVIWPSITAQPGGDVVGSVQTLINATGATLTITTNDTWIAAGTGPIGTIAQSKAIISGITSAQPEAGGWNAKVRDVLALDETNIARTSDTVATLTIPATGDYVITADETITATIPNAVLTEATDDVVASPFRVFFEISGDALVSDITSGLTRNISSNIAS